MRRLFAGFENLISGFFAREKLRKRLYLTQKQAAAFLEQFRDKLPDEERELLSVWSSLSGEKSYFRRLGTVWKYRIAKNDLLRTLGLWWAV